MTCDAVPLCGVKDTRGVATTSQPYDPLDYKNLAASVVGALLGNDPGPLPPEPEFKGCGVYAIYYTGSLPYYSHIASQELATPIYVGKAVPGGGRKGGSPSDFFAGTELYGRLEEHAKSIRQARNLNLEEFRCRFLVVVPVWITLAER